MVSQRTLILECDSDRASLGIFSCAGLHLGLHQLIVEQFPVDDATGTEAEEFWLEKTRRAFRGLRKKAKYRGPAVMVLPAHLCLTKFIKVPRVDAAQREKILKFEAGQNIPYALSDVVWGSVVVAETATETDVLLAAAKLEILDRLCDAANEAGFEISAVIPAQCATVAGFKLTAGTKGGVFLGVNVGDRAATLVLAESGRFALRIVALDAPGAVQTQESKPEESLVARLQQEIARSLLHFQWRTGMAKPDRVCVAGRRTGIAGLADAIGTKLKLPVEVFDLQHVFTGDRVRDQRGVVTDDSTAGTLDLLGAAAAYFDDGQTKVNLLPPRIIDRSGYLRRRPWLIAAASLGLLILLPPVFHFVALRDEAVKKSSAIERELAPLRARDLRIRKNLHQLAEIRDRVLCLQAAGERRDAWLRFFAGLQTQLSEVEDVWLEKLQLAPPVANAPTKLLVSGRMLDRARPLAKASPEAFARVKTLLTRLARASFVAAVESEHFDNRQPGVLQFDFVLVTDPRQPL